MKSYGQQTGVLTKGGNAGAQTDTHGESQVRRGGSEAQSPRELGEQRTLPGAPETAQARRGVPPLDGEPTVFCCSACSTGEGCPSKQTPQRRPSCALRTPTTHYARHGSNHKENTRNMLITAHLSKKKHMRTSMGFVGGPCVYVGYCVSTRTVFL